MYQAAAGLLFLSETGGNAMSHPTHQTHIRQAGIRSTDQNVPPEVRSAAVVPDDSELVYTGDVNERSGGWRWTGAWFSIAPPRGR